MQKYRKAIVAGVGALIIILGRHFGMNNELVLDVITVAIAFGVYQIPNE